MNIIYISWNCFGGEDVCQGLLELGHNVYTLQLSDKSQTMAIDEVFMEKLIQTIQSCKADMVFLFNYFPTISEACLAAGTKYMSWIYDNPATKVYDRTVANACNYVFCFDSYMVQELTSQGVENVFYAPLAVNTKRLQKMKITTSDRKNMGVMLHLLDHYIMKNIISMTV